MSPDGPFSISLPVARRDGAVRSRLGNRPTGPLHAADTRHAHPNGAPAVDAAPAAVVAPASEVGAALHAVPDSLVDVGDVRNAGHVTPDGLGAQLVLVAEVQEASVGAQLLDLLPSRGTGRRRPVPSRRRGRSEPTAALPNEGPRRRLATRPVVAFGSIRSGSPLVFH